MYELMTPDAAILVEALVSTLEYLIAVVVKQVTVEIFPTLMVV